MVSRDKMVSSMGMRTFFDLLVARGVSMREIERETGIHRNELDNPRYRVSMKQLNRLVEYCFEVTGNLALCLNISDYIGQSGMNYTTILLMNCNTPLEATATFSRYAKLLSEANEFELLEESDRYTLHYTNISDIQARWIVEFMLSNITAFMRKAVDSRINPLRVDLQYAAPEYANEYRKVFRAPVLYEQEKNALVFRKKDLQRPIPQANPHLKRVLESQVDALFQEMKRNASFKEQVRTVIQRYLSTAALDVDFISAELGVHRVTLYRKLNQEGTCYKALLQDVRRELAMAYLQANLDNQQIARLLGYSETRAFRHAFKNWFGTSPGRQRAELKQEQATRTKKGRMNT